MTKKIMVIANPAAGQDIPILGILNRVFQKAGVDWDLRLTKGENHAYRLTELAVQEGYDIVAVYGGDGSVREVANALMGGNVPMAILPGGTANVMSVELGIPADLTQACELACSEDAEVRIVDVGATSHGNFILRVGVGLEAEMVEGADRDLKGRIGSLAYAFSALQALQQPVLSTYKLNLDGEELEVEGLTCLICNSGSIGQGTFTLSPKVSVSDGLLDVFVLRSADITTITGVIRDVLARNDANRETFQHWQAERVRVEASPNQNVQADGESLGETPIEAYIIPGALKVLVPRQTELPVAI